MTPSLLILLLLGAAWTVQGSVIDRVEQDQDALTGVEDTEQGLYGDYYEAPVEMDEYEFEDTGNGDDYMYGLEQDDINEYDMAEMTSDVESMLGGPIGGSCRGSLKSGLTCSVCVRVQKRIRRRNLKASFCASIRIQKKTVKVYLNGRKIFEKRISGKDVRIRIPTSLFGPAGSLIRSAELKVSLSGSRRICVQLEIRTRFFFRFRFPNRPVCF